MITDKKNQHYIPKFYLRNFSFQLNKKQVGIYHVSSNFFFQQAKLKTQGSKDFYYGEDGKTEDNLSKIEGLLAEEIKDIILEKKIPTKESYKHLALLTFVGLTHLRNPVLIDYIKFSRAEMKRRVLEMDENANTDKIVPNISHEEAIELSLSG